MSLRAFDAVLFDLDDTLHDDTAAYRNAALRVAEGLAGEYGVDPEALAEAYVAGAERFWSALDIEHLSTSLAGLRVRMWSEALRAVGVHKTSVAERAAADYNRFRADSLHLFPGVLPLLDGLRAAGRRTALITNGFAETHREKIALLRLEQAFDAVLLADEVGMVKPDPRIFLHACELVDVSPSASVMVGDRYDRDIAGAIDAGLATIWLNPTSMALPDGALAPDAVVGSFEGVAGALAPSLLARP